MKVIVVDDTPENVYLLESLLKGHGYEVSSAVNGIEALEKLKQEPAGLIISDILMPKMDGFQLCRAVKSDKDLNNIPFIFYTATYTTEKDKDFALSLGASRFILKPTNPDDFIDIINEVLVERGTELIKPGVVAIEKETEYLKEHQARLINKLEDKITELERSEERYRSLISCAIDAIVTLDEAGMITSWNEAAKNIFGYNYDEVIGKHVSLIVPEEFRSEHDALLLKLKEKESSGYYETVRRSKNGNLIPVWMSLNLMKNKHGKVLGVSAIIRDMTEHKKLEDQLRQAQKMEAVGTLAGGIAHDFNNILNVIIGYGNMLMDSFEAGSPSKEQMNEVLSAAERAANLSKRLLVFSRKQVVEVKPVDINELILGLQKMLVRIIRESIEFKLELTERPLTVSADAGQIEQILMNLAANARDAMKDGGCLRIGTGLQELDGEYVAAYGYGKPGMYVLITVADTGHGMDAATKEKIFEPFFTTKAIGEGTGLGLAISYGILKQHNGYMKVYSEPGQGTEFKIYLPLIEGPASPDRKMEATIPAKGGNETILVAEDDASLRKLMRMVLESNGYKVITAEDGEDAITKFMENREIVSLALIDMIMPKKSGKEVGEAIRKASPLTRILFASGYTMDIIKTRELIEAGFDFMIKPVPPRDLLKKVREILDEVRDTFRRR